MRSEFRLRDAKKILNYLENRGYRAMLAGGCVRDRLWGKEPKDYDIATTAQPDEVCSLFEQIPIRVIPTGIEHGTVTIAMPSGPVEVTTLRRDVATDGRRATIEFSSDFREDAARRDFTINAMFEDKNGKVHDYFEGISHLAERQLVFVGDARTRIREDYLRIMRFFRFWATLDCRVNPEYEGLIREEASGLERVSQERITSELLQIGQAGSPHTVCLSMERCGVLEKVLAAGYHLPDSETLRQLATLPKDVRPLARLAAFYLPHRNAAEVKAMGQHLRLSLKQTHILLKLLCGPAQLSALPEDHVLQMEFLDWCEEGEYLTAATCLEVWAVCQKAPVTSVIRNLQDLERTHGQLRQSSRTKLLLSGSDIMRECRLSPGPGIGEHLILLRRAFRRGQWRTKAEGIAWLCALVSKV